ncbi:MAG: hypothetical protein KDB40_24490 [Acidimicrobiales bacterium]|nr:hypothetical protein [Acidimicrobiales bacterium]MCB9392579.1 hypothetical protein [Acidimicrobiaceae bacterium]
MLSEFLTAYAYELQAVARPRKGRFAGARSRMSAAGDAAAATAVGQYAGDAVRRFGDLIARLPIVTWQADAMAARHGVDTLRSRLERRDATSSTAADAITAIQLAEALRRIRTERWALRSLMVWVNPVGTSASTVMGSVARAGAGPTSVEKLVRFAHRGCAASTDELGLHGHAAQARVWLICDRPGRAFAAAHASASMIDAMLARHEPPSSTRWQRIQSQARSRDFASMARDAKAAARHVVVPTYEGLSDRDALARRLGTCHYVIGRAYLDVGDTEASARAAARALELGQTMGYDLQARLIPANGKSFKTRADLLQKISAIDQRHVWGTARKDLSTMAGMSKLQAERAATLLADIGRAVT